MHKIASLALALGLSAALGWAAPARADEPHDWAEWNALLARLQDQKADAATAVPQYQAFARAPGRMVLLSCIALNQSCQALQEAKQTDEALSVCNAGLAQWGSDSQATILVGRKAQLLAATGHTDEIAPLLRRYDAPLREASSCSWHTIIVMNAALALRAVVESLNSGGQGEQATRLLQHTFVSMPAFGDEAKQGTVDGKWLVGWMWDALDVGLAKSPAPEGKAARLGWAKARYLLCAFNTHSLEVATASLNSAWAGDDAFDRVMAFAKAQTIAGSPNPLDAITLRLRPEEAASLAQSIKVLSEAQGKALEFDEGQAKSLVNALLLRSATQAKGTPEWKASLRVALRNAKKLLTLHPDQTEAALGVARVIKAADGNAMRANAFLSYLNGDGANPLPALEKELA